MILMQQTSYKSYKNKYYICHNLSVHFHIVLFLDLCSLSLYRFLILSWYKPSSSICPWFLALTGFRFKIWKCLANPYLTLSSINGHSLIWCPIWWQYVQHGELGLGILFTLWIFFSKPLNSSNYASILLNMGFTTPHSYSHRNTFYYCWFCFR